MVDGLAVVDKPAGCTSHDVVGRCRRIFGQKRVGHAGTLDPDATGVLLVGLGRATRLLKYVADLPKTYTAEVVLGTSTSTLDASGDVTGTWDMSEVSLEDIATAAKAFVGDIEQIPPMVSAVQVGGKRLHQLARAGVEVERVPRPVTVHRFDVIGEPSPGVVGVEVECSTGTYVRTLADDLGRALGGGAHLRALRRTAIGPFRVEDAHALDGLGPDAVLPPAAIVDHLPSITIDASGAEDVACGRPLSAVAPTDAPLVAVLDGRGRLLAVYRADAGRDRLVADVVLAAN